jgi:hypothetical protein
MARRSRKIYPDLVHPFRKFFSVHGVNFTESGNNYKFLIDAVSVYGKTLPTTETNMTIEFDLDEMTERGRKLLLMKSNEWSCPPAEALSRILEAAAKRAKITVPPTTDHKEAA